jgi:hypothetical protein
MESSPESSLGSNWLSSRGISERQMTSVYHLGGFGYPQKKLRGRKNRKPRSEVAFLERYVSKLDALRN